VTGVLIERTLPPNSEDVTTTREKGRGMRRTFLSVIVMVTTVMVAATAAIAATITCTGGFCEGTPQRDEITGSSFRDDIHAKASVDLVNALGGNDLVQLAMGGTPVDMEFVEGGIGSDELRGGRGSDELDDFEPANIDDTDRLFGQENDDFLYAVDGDSNDTLNGGPGADDCYGDDGDEIVKCEAPEAGAVLHATVPVGSR
jgi:Ca2+-binding RTX toxin-like protein